jgi:TP901 family phage tail tape measure protein
MADAATLSALIRIHGMDQATGDLQRFRTQMQMTEQRTGGLASGLGSLRNVLAGIGITLGGAMVLGQVRNAIASFASFEQSIARAGAISRATADEMVLLADAAQEMGRTTQFRATEAAEALTFLSMAGFDVREATEALPGVLHLAAAAQVDLASAADIATNIMSGFGLQVLDLARVNDVLANTMTSSNTSLVQLAAAMAYAGPVAEAAGISLEETAAAIGLMGNAGIQGERAGTALRGALARLINPVGEAKQALADLGVVITDDTLKTEGLAGTLKILTDAGLEGGQVLQLFGQEAGPGMQALLSQGADELAEFTEAVKENGTAAEIATRQMETLQGSFQRFASAWDELIRSFADNEGIKDFVDAATVLVLKLNEATGASEETGFSLGRLFREHPATGGIIAAFEDARDAVLDWGDASEEDIARQKRFEATALELAEAFGIDLTPAVKEATDAVDKQTEVINDQADAFDRLKDEAQTYLDFMESIRDVALENRRINRENGIAAELQASKEALAEFNAQLVNLPNLGLEAFEGLTEAQKQFILEMERATADLVLFGNAEAAAEEAARMLGGELELLATALSEEAAKRLTEQMKSLGLELEFVASDLVDTAAWTEQVARILAMAEEGTITWAMAEELLRALLPNVTDQINEQADAARALAREMRQIAAAAREAAQAQGQFAGIGPTSLPVNAGFTDPVAAAQFASFSAHQLESLAQNFGIADLEGFQAHFLGMVQGLLASSLDRAEALMRAIMQLEGMLPGFAGGVQNFGGGLALVGERGPEIVSLPRGSNVYSNGTGPMMGEEIHIHNNFAGSTFFGMDDVEQMMEQKARDVYRRVVNRQGRR